MSEFAGTLRQRIEFWRRATERLPSGASSEVMSHLLTCHAAVVAEGAGQPVEAMSVSAMARFRVTMRSNDEITLDQEVRWRGRRLSIRQIIEDPAMPDRMVLRCEEQR